ncbi:hypothetical protein [Craurococcus roseus]
MPPLPFLNQLIREAASEVFGEGAISRVSSKEVADSYGDDVLSVCIVFTGVRSHDFVQGKMMDASAAIRRILQHYGEERFATVDYDAEGGWERKRRKRPTAETKPSRGGKVGRGARTPG